MNQEDGSSDDRVKVSWALERRVPFAKRVVAIALLFKLRSSPSFPSRARLPAQLRRQGCYQVRKLRRLRPGPNHGWLLE